jgi:predicted amidohydrolase YtcJ
VTGLITSCFILFGSQGAVAQSDVADVVYFGGDILTMRGERPEYVSRLAVKDGRIVYAGPTAGAKKFVGPATTLVDLGGKTLLPGFIDAHGHIIDYTMRDGIPDLSPPPVSDITSIDQLVERMKEHIAKHPTIQGKIAYGLGYDDSLLKERRHPTSADLDRISTEVPILLTHVSGHLVAVNSKAMALASITKDTPDPAGGIIQKDPKSGEPNGIFEEQAGQVFMPFLAFPKVDERVKLLDKVMHWYASFGITTAEDAISNPLNIAIMLQRRKQDAKPAIDIISYPMWKIFDPVLAGTKKLDVEYYRPGYMDSNEGRATRTSANVPTPATIEPAAKEKIGVYVNGIKFGGIKITGDGAPVGKTAYLTKPYIKPPQGQPADYRAYPTLEQAELDTWFDAAYKNDIQIVMHVNGDATGDMLIAAVRKAEAKYGKKDLRPVSIHSQWVRHDQIKTYKELGIIPSFFTSHTYYWGDFHISDTVGKERAFSMSAMNYANSLGIKFTNATDAPVVPPSPLHLTWTAVNRVSRSGVVVGPSERVTPYVALKAITDYAAYQHFEERSKGTLEIGKKADLVILDRNPLKVARMTIKDIKVVQTIKDGAIVFDTAKEKETNWVPQKRRFPAKASIEE